MEKDSVESNMKPIFLAEYYRFGGRKGESEVDYFTGLLRETDKKEFSFRGIESEIVRKHPR